MSTLIDYTSRKFIDQAEPARRYLVQFRTDDTSYGIPAVENPTGQIIATAINPGGPDHRCGYPVSLPHVRFNDAEAAFDRDHLPYLEPDLCDLNVIRDRLAHADLT